MGTIHIRKSARFTLRGLGGKEGKMQYEVWRRVRKPFRYPSCRRCTWEVFDSNEAGCKKCGKHHMCKENAVDNDCPLIQCDDMTRVCSITGLVLREVRHSLDEYRNDTVCLCTKNGTRGRGLNSQQLLFEEVLSIVEFFLSSRRAKVCRESENRKQNTRLAQHMLRQMKSFKLSHPGKSPNVCSILAGAIGQEKYWRFIEQASDSLVCQAAQAIHRSVIEMQKHGMKTAPGTRTRDLVGGLLYMLKHGLVYHERMILAHIPEVERCLPHENKIEAYFGVSSKVICMTENEVKLIFRESFQG